MFVWLIAAQYCDSLQKLVAARSGDFETNLRENTPYLSKTRTFLKMGFSSAPLDGTRKAVSKPIEEDATIFPSVSRDGLLKCDGCFARESVYFANAVIKHTLQDEHVSGEKKMPVGFADQLALAGRTVEEEPEPVGVIGKGWRLLLQVR